MKPAAFDYIRVETADEALSLLARYGDDARILAGGQSLMAMLNMRLAQPKVLIDIMHVPALRSIAHKGGTLNVPAGVRQAELLTRDSLSEENPLLAKALPWVGHAQTRARGTVCGSIAHADPSAELPLALAVLGGTITLRSAKRSRDIPASAFFIGMMMTDRQEGEMISGVNFPQLPEGAGTAFHEIGRRKGDFAIVSCAAIVSGVNIRLAVGGVNDTPVVKDWSGLNDSDIDDALNALAWSLEARDDLHATARYRRDLVRNLGRQTILEARACAS